MSAPVAGPEQRRVSAPVAGPDERRANAPVARRPARRALPALEPDGLDRQGRPVSAYAGIVTRGIAFGIDAAIVAVVILLIGAGITLIGSILPGKQTLGVAGFVASFGFFVLLAGVYGVVSWMVDGSTPGQAIMRIRVVSVHGGPPTMRQGIRRAVGMVIAAIPFGLGYLGIVTDKRRRGWHDRIARTVVLYSPDTVRPRFGRSRNP